MAMVRNNRTGDEWIEVVGGRPGLRSVRSFPIDSAFPASAKGAGRAGTKRRRLPAPSLADAPQLPLA
jgi:hypothetical protein